MRRAALALLGAGLLALPLALNGAPLDSVRARWTAGDRAGARAELDSLLARGLLPPADAMEGEVLRAAFEEDGTLYEERLRILLGRDLPAESAAPVHLALGKVAFARGELPLALEEFRRARENGLVDEGSLWEGLTAFALGDGEAAITALERAVDHGGPSRERALIALGDTYRVGGRWDEARSAYRRARDESVAKSGWWPVAAYREGECLERLGNLDEAQARWREVMERYPGAYEAPLAGARLRAQQTSAAAPPPPEAPATAVAGSIAVQAGAFRSAENAEELAGRIRARGFARVRVAAGKDGLHRVLVGRFTSREAAEALADSLGTAFGLGYSLTPEEP